MKPFFTIIVPTLNEENFLPRLLKDLSGQTDKNFEIIIVDADSDDNTKKIALEFKTKLPLKIINSKRRYVVHQKNLGAVKALGRFFIFLDADSRISSGFAKKLFKAIEKQKHLIYLPAVYPHGGTQSERVLFKMANFVVEMSQNIAKPIPTSSVLIFEKNFFNFIGGFPASKEGDILYAEDHVILLKAAEAGVKAKYLKNIRVGFSLRRMRREGTFNVIRKYIQSATEISLKGKINKKIKYEMGGHLYKKSKSKVQSSK